MASYADRLAKVQTAIDQILTSGQSVSDDGSVWVRADLGKLQAIEQSYAAAAAQEVRAASGKKKVSYGISL